MHLFRQFLEWQKPIFHPLSSWSQTGLHSTGIGFVVAYHLHSFLVESVSLNPRIICFTPFLSLRFGASRLCDTLINDVRSNVYIENKQNTKQKNETDDTTQSTPRMVLVDVQAVAHKHVAVEIDLILTLAWPVTNASFERASLVRETSQRIPMEKVDVSWKTIYLDDGSWLVPSTVNVEQRIYRSG